MTASTEAETPPQAELAENPAQDATASLPREPAAHRLAAAEIGRASCRERVFDKV
jgi:hypothetical protein